MKIKKEKLSRFCVFFSVVAFLAFIPAKCVFRATVGDEEADILIETKKTNEEVDHEKK